MSEYPTCPLPGCGKDLYLVTSASIPVEDVARVGSLRVEPDYWEVVCENAHTIDHGGSDTDGRSARLGYRAAQSLGGVR